jgi:rhodanese-related sulfurtransferase
MIKECNAITLKEKIDAKEKFILIDCRELAEWNEEHIEGATLIPLSVFPQKYETVLNDKNAQIVLQCRSGARSMNACMFLLSQGFTDLTNLSGGILGWMQKEFPVVSES